MAVSKRLRFEILRRDNHACRYCGRSAPEVKLTIDHVVPETLGGSDDPSNLVAACADCNAGKSSVPADAPLVADIQADAVRWSRAMQMASDVIQRDRDQRAVWHEWFEDLWAEWRCGIDGAFEDRPLLPRPNDWKRTIDQFVAAGLTARDIREAVESAMRKPRVDYDQRFRYFCGCAWSMLREKQAIAQDIAPFVDEIDARP